MDLLDFKRKVSKFEVDKNILFTPQNSQADLLFESLSMPPWTEFFNMNDIQALYNTINSKRLSANFDKKKALIDQIMSTRGFKYMHGGTNRHVYVNPDFPWVVAKVPIDAVGMSDNFMEQKNQLKIWPYCAKMIQITPFGVIGFAERVEPILNRAQFNAYKEMIFLVTLQILGKYVLEDIGTDYFKNWAIRNGFGPVLCDYPYIFELDGNKLICNTMFCGGEIDYDAGFNKLYCKKCGRSYEAQSLSLSLSDETIRLETIQSKGGQKPMAARLVKGDKVLSSSLSSDSIVKPSTATKKENVVYTAKPATARLVKGDKVIAGNRPAVTVGEKIMEQNTKVLHIDDRIGIEDSVVTIPVTVSVPVVEPPQIPNADTTPKIKVVEAPIKDEEVVKEDTKKPENSEVPQKKPNDRPRDPKTGHFMKANIPQEAIDAVNKALDTAPSEKEAKTEGKGVWSSNQTINKSSKTRRIIEESVESGDTRVTNSGNRS